MSPGSVEYVRQLPAIAATTGTSRHHRSDVRHWPAAMSPGGLSTPRRAGTRHVAGMGSPAGPRLMRSPPFQRRRHANVAPRIGHARHSTSPAQMPASISPAIPTSRQNVGRCSMPAAISPPFADFNLANRLFSPREWLLRNCDWHRLRQLHRYSGYAAGTQWVTRVVSRAKPRRVWGLISGCSGPSMGIPLMTKSQFSGWDTTAANNSDINDIPLAESRMRVHHARITQFVRLWRNCARPSSRARRSIISPAPPDQPTMPALAGGRTGRQRCRLHLPNG